MMHEGGKNTATMNLRTRQQRVWRNSPVDEDGAGGDQSDDQSNPGYLQDSNLHDANFVEDEDAGVQSKQAKGKQRLTTHTPAHIPPTAATKTSTAQGPMYRGRRSNRLLPGVKDVQH